MPDPAPDSAQRARAAFWIDDAVIDTYAPLLRRAGFSPRDTAPPAAGAAASTMDPQHQSLLDALGFDPATTDQLVARTGFPAAEVSSMLLLLEMQGHVSSEPGGLFTRV